jgi:hypothetical protein
MIAATLLGPVDVLAEEATGGVLLIEFVLLGLVVVNLGIRALAYRRYESTAREEGADAVSRNPILELSNVSIVLGAFYYATVELHAGIVFTVLVLGMFVTDFFEFEARLVEARTDVPLERPDGVLFASLLVFTYIAYQSLFFLVKPLWDAIV